MFNYLSSVAISFSILLNTIFTGNNNQTLSAAQWERKRLGKINAVRLIDTLFFFEEEHCREAWIKWQIIHYAMKQYKDIPTRYYNSKGL
jgi:hypothetical protein